MQLYALDSEGRPVSAHQALRQRDYYCLECEQLVRLRGGPQRRCHFYHLDPPLFCRQHQKGPIHLQMQSHFLQRLPAGDCHLELPFPSIRRIADVAWLSQKLIFEIQCSPISAEEVLARNRDYVQLGWNVIWILHDKRYNQVRLSAAEMALRPYPHFFFSHDQSSAPVIYDQFDICDQGLRYARLPPLPIQWEEPPSLILQDQFYPLRLLTQRAMQWGRFFKGDLMSLFLHTPHLSYLQQAKEKEKDFYSACDPLKWRHLPGQLWQRGIVYPYQILFRFLLERICR